MACWLIDRQHANVGQYGFADPALDGRLFALLRDGAIQDQVDPVAREHQSGDAGFNVHGHGDGAMAWPQDSGDETALARFDKAAPGNRLARGDAAADNGAQQVLDVGLCLDVIGVRHFLVRPGLPADMLLIEEHAGRQVQAGDQNHGELFLFLDRRRNLPALPFQPRLGQKNRTAGNKQRGDDENDGPRVHRVRRLRVC